MGRAISLCRSLRKMHPQRKRLNRPRKQSRPRRPFRFKCGAWRSAPALFRHAGCVFGGFAGRGPTAFMALASEGKEL